MVYTLIYTTCSHLNEMTILMSFVGVIKVISNGNDICTFLAALDPPSLTYPPHIYLSFNCFLLLVPSNFDWIGQNSVVWKITNICYLMGFHRVCFLQSHTHDSCLEHLSVRFLQYVPPPSQYICLIHCI